MELDGKEPKVLDVLFGAAIEQPRLQGKWLDATHFEESYIDPSGKVLWSNVYESVPYEEAE